MPSFAQNHFLKGSFSHQYLYIILIYSDNSSSCMQKVTQQIKAGFYTDNVCQLESLIFRIFSFNISESIFLCND